MLRLWVAATDYANEMSVSDALLNRMADAYRRMRNTAAFLLGNLHGFDPARDLVHPAQMVALDRWAVARTAQLQAEIIEAYREYAFHLVYHKIHNFCIVDLSALYLDIVRDRLYTTPAGSHARRSAQTALYHIAAGHGALAGAGAVLHGRGDLAAAARRAAASRCSWPSGMRCREGAAHDVDWTAFLQLKRDVSRELEKLREAQQIGAPLDAEVDVYCVPAEFERFNALGAELRFLLITSAATVHKVSSAAAGARCRRPRPGARGCGSRCGRRRAPKCVRCWHHRADVGANAAHPAAVRPLRRQPRRTR